MNNVSKVLLVFLFSISIIMMGFSRSKNQDCKYWEKEAEYWKKRSIMVDSAVSLMDFKTQKAKDEVLLIYIRIYKMTTEHLK